MKTETYSQRLCRMAQEATWCVMMPLFLTLFSFQWKRRPIVDRTLYKEGINIKHLKQVNPETLVLQYRKYHFN